jgi:hypothetical protein
MRTICLLAIALVGTAAIGYSVITMIQNDAQYELAVYDCAKLKFSQIECVLQADAAH